MEISTATATEMQNNFGKYLSLVMAGQEVIVTRNGKEVGRFIPKDDVELDEVKAERLKEKYEVAD